MLGESVQRVSSAASEATHQSAVFRPGALEQPRGSQSKMTKRKYEAGGGFVTAGSIDRLLRQKKVSQIVPLSAAKSLLQKPSSPLPDDDLLAECSSPKWQFHEPSGGPRLSRSSSSGSVRCSSPRVLTIDSSPGPPRSCLSPVTAPAPPPLSLSSPTLILRPEPIRRSSSIGVSSGTDVPQPLSLRPRSRSLPMQSEADTALVSASLSPASRRGSPCLFVPRTDATSFTSHMPPAPQPPPILLPKAVSAKPSARRGRASASQAACSKSRPYARSANRPTPSRSTDIRGWLAVGDSAKVSGTTCPELRAQEPASGQEADASPLSDAAGQADQAVCTSPISESEFSILPSDDDAENTAPGSSSAWHGPGAQDAGCLGTQVGARPVRPGKRRRTCAEENDLVLSLFTLEDDKENTVSTSAAEFFSASIVYADYEVPAGRILQPLSVSPHADYELVEDEGDGAVWSEEVENQLDVNLEIEDIASLYL